MSARSKLGIGGFAFIFSIANLLLFLLYFIPYYTVENAEISKAYEYFRIYVDETVRFLLPVVCASVITVRVGSLGFVKAILPAFLLSLTNLAYTLPFYYLLGIGYGGDTPESILLSLAISAIYIAIYTAYTLILVFIIRRALIHFVAKELRDALPKKYALAPTKETEQECIKKAQLLIPEKIFEGRVLDLSSPATLSVFFAALLQFTVYFVLELSSAASYFTEYVGNYRGGEIFYIIFRFVFLLCLLFACHTVSHLSKKYTRAANEDYETDN